MTANLPSHTRQDTIRTTTVSSDGLGWAEVSACSLLTVQRPLRLAEFDELFRTAVTSIERPTDTHARLHLTGGPGLAVDVQRLADAESSCCSFFTFRVTPLDGGAVAFDVEVPPEYVDVLQSLMDRAGAVSGGAA